MVEEYEKVLLTLLEMVVYQQVADTVYIQGPIDQSWIKQKIYKNYYTIQILNKKFMKTYSQVHSPCNITLQVYEIWKIIYILYVSVTKCQEESWTSHTYRKKIV